MKFIVAALPLLAVFTQSAAGIALPRAVGEELEARHHMASGRAVSLHPSIRPFPHSLSVLSSDSVADHDPFLLSLFSVL